MADVTVPQVAAARRRVLTDAQWSALGEDDPGELVDGELVEEEMTDAVHEVVATWFAIVLGAWLLPRGGTVGGAAKFLVGNGRGRKTDVFVFLPGSPKPRRRGASRRAPDIAIEVMSPAPRDVRRDRVEKMEEYASFGIKQYWIVDPEARTVEIFELGAAGHYVHRSGATDGTLEVPSCPGLTLDLAGLWRAVDELPEDEGE